MRRKRPIGVILGSQPQLAVARPLRPRRGVAGQQLGQHLGRVRDHGAELVAREQPPVPADARVGEDHPAAVDQLDPRRHQRHQRGDEQQQRRGREQIEAALDQLRPRPRQVVVDPHAQDVAREEVADPRVVDRQPLQGRDHVDVAVVERQALDQPLAAQHLVELERHHHVRLAEPARQLAAARVQGQHRDVAPAHPQGALHRVRPPGPRTPAPGSPDGCCARRRRPRSRARSGRCRRSPSAAASGPAPAPPA